MGRDSKIGQKYGSSVLSNLEVRQARDKSAGFNTLLIQCVTIPYNMYFIAMVRMNINRSR